MNRLRLGLIGAGRIAQAHAKACAQLADRVELVAVCDADREKAAATADRYGAAHVATDYRDLLALKDLEAVLIALPHEFHAGPAQEAARAGKHILVEKPMTQSLAEAEAMVKAAEDAGVTLMVGQSRRFSHAAQALFAKRAEIGPITRISVNFLVNFPQPPTGWWSSTPGDLIIELQGAHYLDMIVWLMGGLPQRVLATSRSQNPSYPSADEGDIFMMYPDGATATVHLSLNTKPELHDVLVTGEKGWMRMREWGTGVPFESGLALEMGGERLMEGVQIPSYYTLQMAEFVDAVAAGRQPLASGREVLATVKLTEAAVHSAATGEVVML